MYDIMKVAVSAAGNHCKGKEIAKLIFDRCLMERLYHQSEYMTISTHTVKTDDRNQNEDARVNFD